jgi:hypothetical protein
MVKIGRTVVSDDVIEKRFVCDLGRCHGACCVEGESGAPLGAGEPEKLAEIYPVVKPYMTAEGIRAVETQGVYTVDSDGDDVTPLIGDRGACAFVVMEGGIAACAIEKAFRDGRIDFQKPVSCHLYPVRITPYKQYDAVNYHAWDICKPACKLGDKLKVPVYRFVKDALVRKYGAAWYDALCEAAERSTAGKAT